MSLTVEQVETCRRQFPALARKIDGRPAVYFDGPGGTQVPQRVIDAVSHYLAHTNANHGGLYATSRESDELLERAHGALADLLRADDAGCIIFGQNMTSLTFALSRALARTWQPGDEVLVTLLDHDANVSPWVLAARDAGATVKYVRFRPEDCMLDTDDLRAKLTSRTKLVAVGCASNATGGVNPVREITAWAHEAGAKVFLDAVHYAPHALIDVNTLGCDFLACSAYKFFGPHVGVLWGRRELLEEFEAYKVRPATSTLPGKWMTGTQSHESIAGALAAVEYLADLGRSLSVGNALRGVPLTPDVAVGNALRGVPTAPGTPQRAFPTDSETRRAAFHNVFAEIGHYEQSLCRRLLSGLAEISAIKVWGITDLARLDERLPTVSFTHARRTATKLAELLGRQGIFAWNGNYYALNLTESLGLEPEGMLRVGLVHYNTAEEVDRLLEVLREL